MAKVSKSDDEVSPRCVICYKELNNRLEINNGSNHRDYFCYNEECKRYGLKTLVVLDEEGHAWL